jgi:hypothetical protein
MILSLAHKWGFKEVKDLAVRELQAKTMDTIDRIILYQQYDVDANYLVPLYATLCAQDEPPSFEDSCKLGVATTITIFHARESLRANPADGGKSPLPADRRTNLLETVRSLMQTINTSSSAGARG